MTGKLLGLVFLFSTIGLGSGSAYAACPVGYIEALLSSTSEQNESVCDDSCKTLSEAAFYDSYYTVYVNPTCDCFACDEEDTQQ